MTTIMLFQTMLTPKRFSTAEKEFLRQYIPDYTLARIFENMDEFHDKLWDDWRAHFMAEANFMDAGHEQWTKEILVKVSHAVMDPERDPERRLIYNVRRCLTNISGGSTGSDKSTQSLLVYRIYAAPILLNICCFSFVRTCVYLKIRFRDTVPLISHPISISDRLSCSFGLSCRLK